jgi:riboflavin synthase
MFTGIVEETGKVLRAEASAEGFQLRVGASITLDGAKTGDSIAVNGTCLTIVELEDAAFSFGVAPESLVRTNLGSLVIGDTVNLERSVTPTTRMGGHFVQGHVDGTGIVIEVRQDEESIWLRIGVDETMMRWIVPKGYVSLDGISLTVVDTYADGFTVMLVPFTITHVASSLRDVGHVVNVEVDVLGKYVDRILEHRFASGGRVADHASETAS